MEPNYSWGIINSCIGISIIILGVIVWIYRHDLIKKPTLYSIALLFGFTISTFCFLFPILTISAEILSIDSIIELKTVLINNLTKGVFPLQIASILCGFYFFYYTLNFFKSDRRIKKIYIKIILQYLFYLNAISVLWYSVIFNESNISFKILSWGILFVIDDWKVMVDYMLKFEKDLLSNHLWKIRIINTVILSSLFIGLVLVHYKNMDYSGTPLYFFHIAVLSLLAKYKLNDKPPSINYRENYLIKLLLPLVILASMTFYFGFNILTTSFDILASKNLTKIQGEVIYLDYKYFQSGKMGVPSKFLLHVQYNYVVNGKKYSSNRLDITNQESFYSKKRIESKIKDLKGTDKNIAVYYSAINPNFAILKPKLNLIDSVFLIIKIIALFISYLLCLFFLKMLSSTEEMEETVFSLFSTFIILYFSITIVR